jgi:hypothetical protein
MAVCRAWVMLGREVAHYHAVVKAEDHPRQHRPVCKISVRNVNRPAPTSSGRPRP